MIDNSVIEVDGKTYLVVDTIFCEGFKYVFLANEKNNEDFFIQKEIHENEKTYLVNLKDQTEFLKIMQLFAENNK